MSTSVKTAKNLLNDTSCYQCIYYYSKEESCAFNDYDKNLHDELFCDNFREKKIYIGWSKLSVIDLSTSYPADVEAELIRAAANELKLASDDCIKENINEKI